MKGRFIITNTNAIAGSMYKKSTNMIMSRGTLALRLGQSLLPLSSSPRCPLPALHPWQYAGSRLLHLDLGGNNDEAAGDRGKPLAFDPPTSIFAAQTDQLAAPPPFHGDHEDDDPALVLEEKTKRTPTASILVRDTSLWNHLPAESSHEYALALKKWVEEKYPGQPEMQDLVHETLHERHSLRIPSNLDNEPTDRLTLNLPYYGQDDEERRVTRKTKILAKQIRLAAEPEDATRMLELWARNMHPLRTDWLDAIAAFEGDPQCRESMFAIFEYALTQSSFEANTNDYLKLVLAYSKAGEDEKAEKVVESMESRGTQADLAVLTVLLDMHVKAGRLEKAKGVIDIMRSRDIMPDLVAYSSLIDAFCEAGQPSEAEALLKEVEDAGMPYKMESYVSIIRSYGKLGQVYNAEQIFRFLIVRPQYLSDKDCFKLLDVLMETYIDVDDLENAESVLENMLMGNVEPEDTSVARLLEAYAKHNLLDKAMNLLLKLEAKAIRPGVETLTNLIGWFDKLGLIEEAEHLFARVKETALRIECKTFAVMYSLYARSGQVDRAREVLNLASEKEASFDGSAFESMIRGLLDGGYPLEAQSLHKKMQACGFTLSDETERALLGIDETLNPA